MTLGLLALGALVVSCGRPPEAIPETDERAFLRGRRFAADGRYDEALREFLDVIEQRERAPQSHFEAGRIYLDEFGEPNFAIYHLTRFIELRPQSEQAEVARDLIEDAKIEFARQLTGEPFAAGIDKVDLLDLYENLLEEYDRLTGELKAAEARIARLEGRSPPADSSGTTDRPSPPMGGAAEPPPPNRRPAVDAARGDESADALPSADPIPRTYVVRPNDTLYSISRRIYDTPNRWEDIYRANRRILSSPSDVHPGMELILPPGE